MQSKFSLVKLCNQGGNSQNFLGRFIIFFVTLGLKIIMHRIMLVKPKKERNEILIMDLQRTLTFLMFKIKVFFLF